MKKFTIFFTIFILSAIIGGWSNVYAQSTSRRFTYSDWQAGKNPFTIVGKNAKSLIQKLDSTYNWQWDTLTNRWAVNPHHKATHIVYDANNNMTSELGQLWGDSIWINNFQSVYTYDVNNNMTNELTQGWFENDWYNSYQCTNTYDVNNNMTSKITQYWNGSALENNDKFIYTYDVNNNQTNILYYYWNGSGWDTIWQETYVFDVNNNPVSFLSQNWNDTAWVNNYQGIFTIDVNRNLTNVLFKSWGDTGWVNVYQFIYTYDVNHNQTSELDKAWDGSAWVNDWLYNYTYDVNNNNIGDVEQIWNGSVWIKSSQDANTYDANNFRESHSRVSFDSTGTEVIGGDSVYYYFYTVTGINDLMSQGKNIVIFPNPAADIVNLNINEDVELNIYNAMGTLVRSEILEGNTRQINIGDLSNGVYLITIKSKDLIGNQKIIIQR